eukprot:9342777-Pyramimonas_sp.AAC.1
MGAENAAPPAICESRLKKDHARARGELVKLGFATMRLVRKQTSGTPINDRAIAPLLNKSPW